jgi:pimeloyl-ACP methyl ester carboxylesterase
MAHKAHNKNWTARITKVMVPDSRQATGEKMERERRATIPVPLGQKSSFAPAPQCDRTLVVFVHGFRGKALSTWLSFPDFVDKFDGLRNADLLFYGYASRPQRMQNIAINLRSHIDAVWADPGSLGPKTAEALAERPRPAEVGRHELWDRVLFVAHSLGAVVVRRALLDCLDKTSSYDNEHWSRQSSLCLFAPAHSGANIIQLIGETFSTFGIPIGPALKGWFPCLQDLEEGCMALTALRDDYSALPEHQRSLASAVSVILAENDGVVAFLGVAADRHCVGNPGRTLRSR